MAIEPGLSVVFSRRDFGVLPAQPDLQWKVESCAWALPGGPDTAVVSARMGPQAGMDWTALLRCPVKLVDENGLPVWWGYVAGVEQEGFCAALDGLYNRVRVDYRFTANSEAMHATAEDLLSQEQYGQKELFFDLGVISHAARAQAVAQSWLERTCRPSITWRAGSAGNLRLRLRGWWHTLGWRFSLWDGDGRRSYEIEPGDAANIGYSSSVARGAQAFTGPIHPPEWTVSRVRVNLRKVGSPTDFLHLGIQGDSGGNPSGVELEGINIPASSLTTSLTWYEYEFPALSAALQMGQRYHLVFSRSGANSSTNYYQVGLDIPNPVSGALYYKFWNGSAWTQRSPNSIAVHAVWGMTSSGRLIAAKAGAEAGGQFLTGLDAPDNGRWAAAFAEEPRTYRQEMVELLGLGGEDGAWTAEITPGRGLRVFSLPAAAGISALIGPDGVLMDLNGARLPAHRLPLGRWARRQGLPFARPVLVQRARLVEGQVKMA